MNVGVLGVARVRSVKHVQMLGAIGVRAKRSALARRTGGKCDALIIPGRVESTDHREDLRVRTTSSSRCASVAQAGTSHLGARGARGMILLANDIGAEPAPLGSDGHHGTGATRLGGRWIVLKPTCASPARRRWRARPRTIACSFRAPAD